MVRPHGGPHDAIAPTPVAQWPERRAHNTEDVGSTPTGRIAVYSQSRVVSSVAEPSADNREIEGSSPSQRILVVFAIFALVAQWRAAGSYPARRRFDPCRVHFPGA